MNASLPPRRLRAGMVGLGMIFDETYRPALRAAARRGALSPRLRPRRGRAGRRRQPHRQPRPSATGRPPAAASARSSTAPGRTPSRNCSRTASMSSASPRRTTAISTPPARPSPPASTSSSKSRPCCACRNWTSWTPWPSSNGVLAKVVYHKLADPDHKKLRTHVVDGVLRHVNNGYCSLAGAEIDQRQPVRRVDRRPQPGHLRRRPLHQADRLHLRRPAWRLARIAATGQRGLVGPADGPTWDSVQLQMVYAYPDGREAAFDIHTSWVTPDNFPGYVEQEVQFRFDNGVWNAHQRKRGVEVTVEGRTPGEFKIHAQPPLQRHLPGAVGRAQPARLRHRDHSPLLRGSGVRRVRRPAGGRGRAAAADARLWRTTTCRPTATSWRRCRRWRRSCGGTRRAGRAAWSRSTGQRGGLVLQTPGRGGADRPVCRGACERNRA